MIREIKAGATAIDQFPAFEDDGYTKRSGLGVGDFVKTVYRNGVVVADPVTITEIGGSGEYKVQFTPGTSGFYDVQIFILFNKDIWHAEYESLEVPTNEQVRKLDLGNTLEPGSVVAGSFMDRLMNKSASKTYLPATDSLEAIRDALDGMSSSTHADLVQIKADLSRVLGLLHRNSILDKQEYDPSGQLTFARLRVFDSPANVPDVPGGSEGAGLLHEYEIEAEYSGVNIVTKFTLKQVL